MKNLTTLLTLTCLLVLSIQVKAQNNNHFSIKGGVNFSQLSNEVNGLESKNRTGFHLGATYNVYLNNIRLQPGLVFVQRGGKLELSNELQRAINNNNTAEFKLNYLDIPLNVSVKIANLSSNNDGLYLFVEPTASICLSGKLKEAGESKDLNIGSDNTDNIKAFDFGVKLGASIKIGSFEPYIGYNFGLTNINNDDSKVKNKGLYLGLAVALGK
ncbi:PorT family protein [Halosquirtibacter xylanolyticus]|uniref:porin family protein n=1 Tax=Halosquirtibacter xylanolyticus TaxID=3374599 RepID=UPI003748DFF0|nr:PorT family protein [Prolixibacteraceae bacterium]